MESWREMCIKIRCRKDDPQSCVNLNKKISAKHLRNITEAN